MRLITCCDTRLADSTLLLDSTLFLPYTLVQEAPCSSGAIAAAARQHANTTAAYIAVSANTAIISVCTAAAAAAICQPPDASSGSHCVPDHVALSKLRWLLQASPPAALRVLCCAERAADLPILDVLGLLVHRTDDVRWKYLRHLIDERVSYSG